MICNSYKTKDGLDTEKYNSSHLKHLDTIQTILTDKTSSLLTGQQVKPAQSEWINSYWTVW